MLQKFINLVIENKGQLFVSHNVFFLKNILVIVL